MRSEKSICQNATFYEQCPPLHFPFAKSNYFPKKNEGQDFGQSNLALSNVRALRAKRELNMCNARSILKLIIGSLGRGCHSTSNPD